MHVISRKRLKEFWEDNLDAETALSEWFKTVSKAKWENLVEVRCVYSHADVVGDCTIFNIRGNNYRLITKIYYKHQTVLIRSVLTHDDYDEEKWKDDCNC
ncbi:MAG: type II toxin-antitoxin system HigB family toxin [Acidobacteria bacterium]|nr:type II toxin-antitoxin system HigB family toxin [Acidobacteriota bacterium]